MNIELKISEFYEILLDVHSLYNDARYEISNENEQTKKKKKKKKSADLRLRMF